MVIYIINMWCYRVSDYTIENLFVFALIKLYFCNIMKGNNLKNIVVLLMFAAFMFSVKAGDFVVDNNKEVSIYPNPPLNEETFISSNFEIKKIEVLDVVGHKIISKSSLSSRKVRLEVSSIKSGIYFIKVYFDDGSSSIVRLWVND